ncbi:MAG: CehA/McbA family metallohydrolase [Chitinophagaceae bacterium]|nr:CehA/McbA family metallohydrolase [Chitinophagaceae bacterium]MCW5928072.1 CehA/McbA family metallohydrolase [Chitinophagaceae bacterium]
MVIKKTLLLVLLFHPFFAHPLLFAQEKPHESVQLKIRIIEEDTRQITPAMVCITGVKDKLPRIPPYAEIPQSLVLTDSIYYSGIAYEDDKNWIGPVRKMNGPGDNKDRSYVYELLPSIPHWKEPVMYQTSGDFFINFPPGEWAISIEHGNEYIPVKETITVVPTDSAVTKTFILKRWINLPERGWYSGDVHVHHPTTKQSFKDYLLAYAEAEDLHILNVLEQGNDHEIKGARQAGFGKPFREQKNNIWLVSGQEDPSSMFGHIVGLNIDQLVRDTATYNYYDLVFKKLHLQPGAIVGFAHFSWNGCDLPRGFPWLVTTKEIDFVELLQFSRINTLDYYDYLNLGFKLTAAAGSDFPWGSTIGEVRTLVYTGVNFNPDVWFDGLKAGNTFVTNGPALFFEAGGKLPGTEIITTKGANIELTAKAISNPGIGNITHLAIYNNDGLVIEKKNLFRSDSLSINLSHLLTKSQWITAVVYCDNGAVAHTTPVYCVVDCQPTWDKQKAPVIIQKQLDSILLTEQEERSKPEADEGILERLKNASMFYRKLLAEINAP